MVGKHPTMNKDGRQTLLFSATFPSEIQTMAKSYLNPDYAFIAVGIVGGANADVDQTILLTPRAEKRAKLKDMLDEWKRNGVDEKALIFVASKKSADFLAGFLSTLQLNSTSIHGDRLQRERELAINEVRSA
jgi:probable ATP-dependent RNA helicase DDX4